TWRAQAPHFACSCLDPGTSCDEPAAFPRRGGIVILAPSIVRRLLLLGFVVAVAMAAAQDTFNAPRDQQIPPPACFTIRGAWEGGYVPCAPASHAAWLADITHWRMERRIRVGFYSARYTMPELKWAQSAFIQPQMMVHDRYFYDPAAL